MASSSAFISWLRTLRPLAASLLSGGGATGPVGCVIGNEACDADSIVSALVCAHSLEVRRGTPHLPYLHLGREDLKLRGETTHLLDLAGVPSDALLYLEDARALLPSLHSAGRLSLVLVDHNKADGLISELGLGNAVTEIVDHHADAGAHSSVAGDRRCISFDAEAGRGVGSCCTLVGQRMLASGGEDPPDRVAASLLLGVILLDTDNLSPTAGKTTPADEACAAKLRPLFLRGVAASPEALVAALRERKFSAEFWGGLSLQDSLRCDYKQFCGGGVTFGVSSVLLPLPSLLASHPDGDGKSQGALQAELAAFAAARHLRILMVMSLVLNPEPRRELLVVGGLGGADDAALFSELVGYLKGTERLELAPLEPALNSVVSGEGLLATAFVQRNTRASRKQLVPICVEFLVRRGAGS